VPPLPDQIQQRPGHPQPKSRSVSESARQFRISFLLSSFNSEYFSLIQHWEVCCIKHVISPEKNAMVDGPFGSSVNTDTDYVAVGILVIRTVNITNHGFSNQNLKFMREGKFEQLKRHAVYPGDVLFSKVGTIGNSCVLPQSVPEAILSTTGSCKITADPDKCRSEFLVLCIQSMHEELMQVANSNVQPFLNMVNIKNLKLPLPSTTEQVEILGKLEFDLRKLDTVTAKAVSSAALLQERRTALISAAATPPLQFAIAMTRASLIRSLACARSGERLAPVRRDHFVTIWAFA
jgi:type I restriction enzyme S subunit